MAALARSRTNESETAQNQAAVAANAQVTPAPKSARASNAQAQERLREVPASETEVGGEQGGGGHASAAPGGGGDAGLPPAEAIGPKTPEAVLERILYAPSGKGRYRVDGKKLVPVEPGGVSAEQYEAAKKAIEEAEKKNDVRATQKDTRQDQNFDHPPSSMGGKEKEASYTWGDKTTTRTSNGRGDRATIDYTRADGSTKQFDGMTGESPDALRARFNASQANKSIPVDRGFVNDKTQRRDIEVGEVRVSQSGRPVLTYTDLDGKSKEFAGKPGESPEALRDRFNAAKAKLGIEAKDKPEEERRKIWQGIDKKVEAKQTTLWQKETEEARASVYHKETNDRINLAGANIKTQGTSDMLTAQGKAGSKVTAGGGKVHAEATAEGSAKLVAYERTWAWEPEPRELLGETVSGKMYVYVKGFIGAEAQAKIEANASMALRKPKLDPDALLSGTGMNVDASGAAKLGQAVQDRVGADVGAKAQAFAGAKLNIGVGAEGYWHKKEANAYSRQLKSNAQMIVDLLAMGNPGLGWLLRQCGADSAAEKILNLLFQWGAAGKTSLLAIEGGLQGSAGAGVSAEAKMGFSGGKLRLKFGASATWGLGLGGSVSVVFDPIEGVKFALIVMGELKPIVTQWVSEHTQEIINKAGGMFTGIFDWFSADDKVRDAVKNHAHEVVNAAQRAKMCDTLYGGWFSSDDEEAVMTILRHSKSKGDLSAVLGGAPRGLTGSLSAQHRAELGV